MLWKELSEAFLSIFSCYSVDLKDKLPTNFHLPANYLLCIFRDSPFIFFYSTPPFCCSLQGFPSECHLQRSPGSHCSGPFSAPNCSSADAVWLSENSTAFRTVLVSQGEFPQEVSRMWCWKEQAQTLDMSGFDSTLCNCVSITKSPNFLKPNSPHGKEG